MHKECFYTDNLLVEEVWKKQDNYRVEYTRKNDLSCCAVYFSSNGIYYPNDEQTFVREILEKDKYEWYNSRVNRATKSIFVRDVHKEWYLTGINHKQSDLRKLAEWLKHEISGYKEVLFIGSSAGAYCAMLVGYWLNVTTILAFSPQIDLEIERRSEKDLFPYLHQQRITQQYSYFNLKDNIFDGHNIFWFYPSCSTDDIPHYSQGIMIPGIHIIAVETPFHGVFFSKPALIKILNATHEDLIRLSQKQHSYLGINLQMGG